MGRELKNITQYQLTNDIVKNHYVFDIKDGALKVLLILSTHYPNILIKRKSLINRYNIAEKTADRALKELAQKGYINRHDDGSIMVNLGTIYSQIDGVKVVNLAAPCMNKQERIEKNNKHVHDNVVVSLLKGFSFSDDEILALCSKHSTEDLQTYAKYVQLKNTETPKKYLMWCLKEKPVLTNKPQKTVKQESPKTTPPNHVEKYQEWLNSSTPNILTSEDYAKVIVANTYRANLKKESELRLNIEAMLRWNLPIKEYDSLCAIEEKARIDEVFRKKCNSLAGEILKDFKAAGVNLTVDDTGNLTVAPDKVAC